MSEKTRNAKWQIHRDYDDEGNTVVNICARVFLPKSEHVEDDYEGITDGIALALEPERDE